MSRFLSTSARRIKELKWKLDGTTEDVVWATKSVNEAVEKVPGLAAKVENGIIK